MSDIAIRVEGLGKQYRIGAVRERYKTLRDQIASVFSSGREKNRQSKDTIWALKDVSFEIKKGEVVGVIGRNGAGKSTLLKILSRITEPTEGSAEIYGRVGSLLEVGTGFHNELTGRENIFLNGAILGMKRAEIQRRFDEIVAFAEVEKFIDTPVKHYSSGMYLRLAFAVAAHLETEILLVDEVLAVGDANFQKKCLGKMEDVTQKGRTILFVSHNMSSIQKLCPRVVVLNGGEIQYFGPAETGIKQYLDFVSTHCSGDIDLASHPARRPGCTPLLRRVRFLDKEGLVRSCFQSGEMIQIEFAVDPVIPLSNPQFAIGIDDWMGTRIFSVGTYWSEAELPPLHEKAKVVCLIQELPLPPGKYTLSLSAGTPQSRLLDALDSACSFEVEEGDFFRNGKLPSSNLGKVLVRSSWSRGKLTSE